MSKIISVMLENLFPYCYVITEGVGSNFFVTTESYFEFFLIIMSPISICCKMYYNGVTHDLHYIILVRVVTECSYHYSLCQKYVYTILLVVIF